MSPHISLKGQGTKTSILHHQTVSLGESDTSFQIEFVPPLFFRSVLQHLMNLVSDGILKVYENIVKGKKDPAVHCPLNQQRALQLLFDIKFVLLIIPRKDDSRVIALFLTLSK